MIPDCRSKIKSYVCMPAVLMMLLVVTTAASYAGPPLASDDAALVEPGKVEIELNGAYSSDKTGSNGLVVRREAVDGEVKISTGLHRDLAVSLAIPYTVSNRVTVADEVVSQSNGLGDMGLELKYAFAELAGIRFAIKPVVMIPTGNYGTGLSEGRWQFGSTLIATRELAEGKYALHANLGYERHRYRSDEIRAANRANLWSASAAGEAELCKGLFVAADIGLATTADTTVNELSSYVLAGLRYGLNDFLELNAGVKLGLTRPEDDLAFLFGLTLKL